VFDYWRMPLLSRTEEGLVKRNKDGVIIQLIDNNI